MKSWDAKNKTKKNIVSVAINLWFRLHAYEINVTFQINYRYFYKMLNCLLPVCLSLLLFSESHIPKQGSFIVFCSNKYIVQYTRLYVGFVICEPYVLIWLYQQTQNKVAEYAEPKQIYIKEQNILEGNNI